MARALAVDVIDTLEDNVLWLAAVLFVFTLL
jgi:hypothetical protein